MYHACVNYNMPLYHEDERMCRYLKKAVDKVREDMRKMTHVFQRWKIFVKHANHDLYDRILYYDMEGQIWKKQCCEELDRYCNNHHRFTDHCTEWHSRCKVDSLTLQDVVNYFNPRDDDKWDDSFRGELYYMYIIE